MDVIEAIESRSSAKKFTDEVPARSRIEALLHAAARAPDHGALAPWRFAVMQGESRALLGDAMVAALRERMPDVDAEACERERSKAFRSPVLIAVAAAPREHPKVPEIEQIVAVGAAIENLLLAARGMGLATMWKTGSHAYHPAVQGALGFEAGDRIIGFVHVGVAQVLAPVRNADIGPVTRWL
jgi:nitroreductase